MRKGPAYHEPFPAWGLRERSENGSRVTLLGQPLGHKTMVAEYVCYFKVAVTIGGRGVRQTIVRRRLPIFPIIKSKPVYIGLSVHRRLNLSAKVCQNPPV